MAFVCLGRALEHEVRRREREDVRRDEEAGVGLRHQLLRVDVAALAEAVRVVVPA